VDVFLQKIQLPQLVVQLDVRHDVGLVPVVRVLPTFGYHGLSCEIDYIGGAEIFDFLDYLFGVMIQVQLPEQKTIVIVPLVRKQAGFVFNRTAYA
jgi:hypothetical protein